VSAAVVAPLGKGDAHSLRAPPSQDTVQNRRDPRELISLSLNAPPLIGRLRTGSYLGVPVRAAAGQ